MTQHLQPSPPAVSATVRAFVPLALCLLLVASPASAGSCLFAPQIQLTQVASGLSSPVAVRNAGDGSGRLFIVQQGGQILIYNGNQVLPTPFLDIDPRVRSGGERGLLGLAFDPDYASNGFFYVHYTAESPVGANVISRFSVSAGDPNVADAGSEMILLTINQPFSNHNGGDLAFGPDGFLYASVGDGGGAGDTSNNAQNPGNLLGTLLRLNSDGSIPPSNPFVGNPSARDEIWAYGLRNPWRFSFDRHTGDLFIGDVGQGTWEEIDYQPASSSGGENYGWRCYEGDAPFNTAGCGPAGDYVFPILVYDHSLGNAVTGGYRYRGPGGAPFGYYLYADYGAGRIWGAQRVFNGGWAECQLLDTNFLLSSFGEDEEGRLYVTDLSGSLQRIDGAGLFGDSFETGLGRWAGVVGATAAVGDTAADTLR